MKCFLNLYTLWTWTFAMYIWNWNHTVLLGFVIILYLELLITSFLKEKRFKSHLYSIFAWSMQVERNVYTLEDIGWYLKYGKRLRKMFCISFSKTSLISQSLTFIVKLWLASTRIQNHFASIVRIFPDVVGLLQF